MLRVLISCACDCIICCIIAVIIVVSVCTTLTDSALITVPAGAVALLAGTVIIFSVGGDVTEREVVGASLLMDAATAGEDSIALVSAVDGVVVEGRVGESGGAMRIRCIAV